nr:hypothetical protein [Deltaproteobacteria bacterium]
MMNTRINRWSLVLWATALGAALAGCSDGQSVVGGPGDAAVANDLAAEAATDAPVDVPVDAGSPMDAPMDVAMDVPMDVAMDAPMDTPADMGPPRCTSATDCMTNPGRGACDTATGMCVQCVASSDTCPATEHCNGATNTCEPGCRSDDGCMSSGGPTDGGAVARTRCDVTAHTCVECVTNEHCPSGTLCVGSVCVMGCTPERGCPSGQSCCSGACVDGQTNLAHCGRCDNRCSVANAMPLCLNGTCGVGACNAPFGDCDSSGANGCETNTQTDLAHCGACNRACPARANATTTCASGACGFTCTPGFSDCDGDASNGCEVNTATSTTSCGACGRACNPPNGTASCAAGVCAVAACDEGFGDCNGNPTDGCETNVRTSTTHCGRCMNECPARPNGFPGCVAGACVISCVAGFADCNAVSSDGCEVDTRTTTSNCGSCGRECTAVGGTASCVSSVCRVAGCDAGRGDCDGSAGNGCEVDVTSAVAHCGGCGMACAARANASSTCASGACGIACNAGFGDCDRAIENGCEVSTTSTVTHCGACGRMCALANATAGCAASACTVATCDTGYGDCDSMAANGCEVDVRSSATHCGTCGRACTYANAAGVCRGGACSMGTCNAGFSDCDYNPANGCETAGACVYASCNAIPRAAPTGVYTLSAGGTNWRAYCDMTSDGGGWTLVMKVPGRDPGFVYSSAIWTNTSVLNEASTDLSTTPAKFRGFFTLPFQQLRVGMVDGSPRYLVVPVSSSNVGPLNAIFAGPARATSLGRNAWRTLVGSPSLQPFCNAEGFNMVSGGDYQAVRLGIVTNQENDCGTADSRLGFGGQFNRCGAGGDVSCGNISTCGGDAGDRDNAFFGYLFVR